MHIFAVLVSDFGVFWVYRQEYGLYYYNDHFHRKDYKLSPVTLTTLGFLLLGAVDIMICVILCRLCLVPSANTRILIDKHSKQVYYVTESIPVGNQVIITEVNSEEEEELDVENTRLFEFDRDSFAEVGWEGMIIA